MIQLSGASESSEDAPRCLRDPPELLRLPRRELRDDFGSDLVSDLAGVSAAFDVRAYCVGGEIEQWKG